MEKIINTFKTRKEVEDYRKKINEACDKRSEFITLCEHANSLSEKSFGYIKEAFEGISPMLFKTTNGKKIINRYAKTIRNTHNLSALHKIYENIRKAGSNMDLDFFVNNIANTEWGINSDTLNEDVKKIGRILSEGYLLIGKDAASYLPNENKVLSAAVEYIAENKKSKNNIAEYSNAVKIIKENITTNNGVKNLFETTNSETYSEDLLREFNEKYSNLLNIDEISILREISTSEDREAVFNRYKNACAEKISEAKCVFENKGDKESSNRLSMVLEQISSKNFSLDTVGTDICKLIELSNIF